jgi:acetyltransferase-like isoleucine patch superfamily enzyme
LLDQLRRIWLDGRLYIANHIIAHVPSHTVRLLYYRAVMKAKIGPGASIFMGAWFDTVGSLCLGTNSTVNQNCRLDARGGLVIGSNVSISAEVCILTAEHDIKASNFSGVREPVEIGDHVFIGTRAMILPGVTLAIGSVVAAGAVVTKSVGPYSVAGGVPARIIGSRNADLSYTSRYRRLFH